MLLSIFILNLLVTYSFSQPNVKQPNINIALSTSPSFQKPSRRQSNSPFQAQATIEVQVDGLDSSAIISMTREADSSDVGSTSVSTFSADLSPSLTEPVAMSSPGTSIPSASSSNLISSNRCNVSAFQTQTAFQTQPGYQTQPAISILIAYSSQSFNNSIWHPSALESAMSARVSAFTGLGIPLSQGLLDPTILLTSGLLQLAISLFL